ncbi:UDP-N-acetyl-D-mannosamine dehydrogenase [Nocardioides sp. JQ2195]|uniref:UDP-N-acetyl-D-mannosamine dehydrogenase n=1 Tax=Nocardioides sp. JQ2195 TaxID=2592334 RepID=UPI00143EAA1A|nr:UDP-N-acetyl-D-mannosamine dehydrogenase [Nocardioides sp. JQ2195]QIX27849.1 UDP-N-acetyl-D-mannosamine dehydrogenase [Nocardioides sp. JQ2195]
MDDIFSGRVAILGLGYIGLPTAAVLATRGIEVIGVDVNAATVEAVSRGEVPFVEPDLGVAVSGAVSQGNLSATSEVPEADAFIIAVPTPFMDEHRADLHYIRAAVESIAPRLRGGEVVILESTSPPGTTVQVSRWLAELRPDLTLPHCSEGVPDVYVAHCPERVLPGRIMIEMVTNDRVVGGISPRCAEKAAAVYRVFTHGKVLLSDAASAEMAKLVENAYRDVNIAFANELALVSETLQLDVWEIIKLANHHPRVNVLTPGPGVGGHCIAVDPWFIVGAAPDQARLMRASREINDAKPIHVAEQIVAKTARFKEPTVACLGLAYKANVDDLRESPAVDIVLDIAKSLPELDIRVAEPLITALPASFDAFPHVVHQSAVEAIEAADIVVLLVDHDHFRSLSRSRLEGKIVYDTCGLWRRS